MCWHHGRLVLRSWHPAVHLTGLYAKPKSGQQEPLPCELLPSQMKQHGCPGRDSAARAGVLLSQSPKAFAGSCIVRLVHEALVPSGPLLDPPVSWSPL